MTNILRNNQTIFTLLLFLIGGFLRFYNLYWGAPFYFHPDERNIASSISQLQFPQQMNPHFFAYGSFPLYLIYFSSVLWNILKGGISFTSTYVSFELAIITSRFLSAFLSTILLVAIHQITLRIGSKSSAFFALFFTSTSVGLIQFAHFGTFEALLTFLSLFLFYSCIKIIQKNSISSIILSGIILGLLIATKFSSIPLIILPILSIYYSYMKNYRHDQYTGILVILLQTTVRVFSLLFFTFLIFFICSPFVFFDFYSFQSSINYESSVAFGTLPVFYTQEFFNTIPILFQFKNIYPFVLNPILTVLFIVSFVYLFLSKRKDINIIFLLLSFLVIFLTQSFLFVKWTRYIIPTLPFIYLIIAVSISDLLTLLKKRDTKSYYQYTGILVVGTIIAVSALFVFSYFVTAHVKSDTRIHASLWAKTNIPHDAKILSEIYDLGITPFNPYFTSIKLFNFYELEDSLQKQSELFSEISLYDYVILPSQRIIKSRISNPAQFPVGNKFYTNLLNKKLGFSIIYQTPCDIFCKIAYLGNPIFSLEETASVFDRPTIMIYKKI